MPGPADPDATPVTWLISDGMDRERMLDMDRLVAPVRQRSFVVIAVALLLCGPWLGWWTIAPLALAAVLFKIADGAVERVSHPEYMLFAAWTASQLMIAVLCGIDRRSAARPRWPGSRSRSSRSARASRPAG